MNHEDPRVVASDEASLIEKIKEVQERDKCDCGDDCKRDEDGKCECGHDHGHTGHSQPSPMGGLSYSKYKRFKAAQQIPAGSSIVKRHEFNALGRNDKCPCGSGQKYKKCCYRSVSVYELKEKNPAV